MIYIYPCTQYIMYKQTIVFADENHTSCDAKRKHNTAKVVNNTNIQSEHL